MNERPPLAAPLQPELGRHAAPARRLSAGATVRKWQRLIAVGSRGALPKMSSDGWSPVTARSPMRRHHPTVAPDSCCDAPRPAA